MASSKKDNSTKTDKLLSSAYKEFNGTKKGDRELAFIESVFNFLNRQSQYLSNDKVADKLLKLSQAAIDEAGKKNAAIQKKGGGKVYTKADKNVDKEQIALDKKKLKKKIATAKETPVKTDKYSTSSKNEKADKKNTKNAPAKTADIEQKEEEEAADNAVESAQEVRERIERICKDYSAKNVAKDWKTMQRILGRPDAKRVATPHLMAVARIIRAYAPSVCVDAEATKPIRGTDRAFRISSNYAGKVYISDFEFAYQLAEDPKNHKVWNAALLSNHAICRHDASSVYVDHGSRVFFHELSSFKNEALMVFEPNKPAPKRTLQYKPAGDRCVYTDSYCHAQAKEVPQGYSVVFIKNGAKHLSLNKIPVAAGGPKLARKEWTKFDQKVPDAAYLVLNRRHDTVFCLTLDFERYQIRLSCVLLSKSVKEESKIMFVKQWEDFDFEALGYPKDGFWPKAISMCYLRDKNYVCVGIQKHLFIVAENPNQKHDYYTYYAGNTTCLLYDICEHPTRKNAILAVDGVIKNCKLYEIDVL